MGDGSLTTMPTAKTLYFSAIQLYVLDPSRVVILHGNHLFDFDRTFTDIYA